MKKFQAVLVSGFLMLQPALVLASDIHDFQSEVESKGKRPTDIWNIDRYVNFLSAAFQRPTSNLVKEYSQSLPAALDALVNEKSVKEISPILAELFDTVDNHAEIKKMVADAKALKEDEQVLDTRALALLDAMLAAASGLSGELIKDEKSAAFNNQFFGDGKYEGDYARQKKITQAEIAALIKKINAGNNSAAGMAKDKQELRSKLHLDAAFAWYESQMRQGNTGKALDMIRAISWVDSSGQRFLDLVDGNTAERLYIGDSPAQIQNALAKYGASKGGLYKIAVSENEHRKGQSRSYYIDEADQLVEVPRAVAKSSSSASGARTAVSPARPAARIRAAAPATGRVRPASRPAVRFSQASNAEPSSRVRVKFASSGNTQSSTNAVGDFSAMAQSTCSASCHVSWPKSPEAMAAAVERGSMPPAGPVSDDVKKAFADWLRQGGLDS